MITFATFHIDCTSKAANHISKNNVYLDNRNEYLTQIDLMFRSATLAHSNCKKVILTDLHTDLSGLSPDIHVYRLNLDSEMVMLSRLQAQLHYVSHEDSDSNIVLLDSDMLIQNSLDPLFAQVFNIGLTCRDPKEDSYQRMPFNGGVIFVSKYCKMQAIQFLEQVYTIYQDKYTHQGIWWGDQYALLDTIGAKRFFNRCSDLLEVEGSKILVVPCNIYNFSPKNQISSILFELKDKRILHFKGSRKRLICTYWKTYLEWRENSSSRSWVQAFGDRTRLLSATISEGSSNFLVTAKSLVSKMLQKGRRTILKYGAN
jgi:hypothetical protein